MILSKLETWTLSEHKLGYSGRADRDGGARQGKGIESKQVLFDQLEKDFTMHV